MMQITYNIKKINTDLYEISVLLEGHEIMKWTETSVDSAIKSVENHKQHSN